MNEIFKFKEPHCSLRNNHSLSVTTVSYGTKRNSALAPKIWSLSPPEIKNKQIFFTKNTYIPNKNCSCHLCKAYIQNIILKRLVYTKI